MNEAFKRREQALAQFAVLKAQIVTIYFAHRDWDWATKQTPHGGRAALPKARVASLGGIARRRGMAKRQEDCTGYSNSEDKGQAPAAFRSPS